MTLPTVQAPNFSSAGATSALKTLHTRRLSIGDKLTAAHTSGDTNCCKSCKKDCNIDLLKVEIFRDFFQFMGIYLASIQFPKEFRVFFGSIAQLVSINVSDLFRRYQLSSLVWFVLFLILMTICWTILFFKIKNDTHNLKGSMGKREDRDKFDWTEINAKSTTRYYTTLGLLFFLMTMYVFCFFLFFVFVRLFLFFFRILFLTSPRLIFFHFF